MANTLYVAVYTAAATATWARADLGNGRNGWSASGYVGSVVDGTIRTDDGDEAGSVAGLSAGTAYKLWAIVDDGSASSNAGAAQASGSWTTAVAPKRYGFLGFLPAPIAGAITAPNVAPPTPSGASVSATHIQVQTTPSGAYQTIEFEIRRDE